MLVTMGILRLAFGWPTPTELIFDRLFPFLTVEFFIGSLVKAGGYTPLKLQGVYGALAGQVAVAAIGGVIYSWYLNRLERRQHSRQRGSRNCRRARVAVDRAGCIGGHCAVRNSAVADVDHELSWAAASAGANRRFTRNADFVQCVWIRHHAFPRADLGAARTEQYRRRGRAHGRPETFPCAGDRRRARHSAGGITAPALPDRHIRRTTADSTAGQECRRSHRFARAMNFTRSQKI